MTETSSEAAGQRVALVVSGGIAAYKACELVRRLRDRHLDVRVAMTCAATRLVSAHTLAALSGHRVIHSLFEDPRPHRMAHVRWGETADLLCVAPATANFIAKMAHGIADDFATTLCLTTPAPVLVAPAMEDDMYAHAAVQRNLSTLAARGDVIVGPASGALASGRVGPGRMVEPDEIAATAVRLARGPAVAPDLAGKRVLITAGPTLEALDPIRFIGNRSSGKMGFALAREAHLRGASVTLVAGPTTLTAPAGVAVERVESAAEMAAAVETRLSATDILVMAAAVGDFAAAEPAAEKIKKADRSRWAPELVATTDILAAAGARSEKPMLVGFAAETDEVEARALEKLERKGCDFVVGNRVGRPGSGMGADDNEVIVVGRDGGRDAFGPAPKWEVAAAIWSIITARAPQP